MRSILLLHAARYPAMEPGDAVKLIYQNEFGGGHLIREEEACLDRLRKEYAATFQTADTPLYEDIGNGMIRVFLNALDAHGYTVEALGQAFLQSAASHQGRLDRFVQKLEILSDLTASGKMPFSPEALTACLAEYAAAGYPAVSHSQTYQTAYHPAYRIICKQYLPQIFDERNEI